MNVESLDFWHVVKMEFLKTQYFFLCPASVIFEYGWHWYNKEIKELADEFLKNSDYFNLFTIGNGVLFEHDGTYESITNEIRRQIRIDFINWVIEKFKNA